MKISRYFDSAVLKPNMTEEEVKAAIQLGIDYDSYSVCVRPCDIDLALEMCKGTNFLIHIIISNVPENLSLSENKARYFFP